MHPAPDALKRALRLWGPQSLHLVTRKTAGLVALPRALSLLGLVAGGVGLALTLLLALLAHHYLARANAHLAGTVLHCIALLALPGGLQQREQVASAADGTDPANQPLLLHMSRAGNAGRGPSGVADVAHAALGSFWAVLSDTALAVNCFGEGGMAERSELLVLRLQVQHTQRQCLAAVLQRALHSAASPGWLSRAHAQQ